MPHFFVVFALLFSINVSAKEFLPKNCQSVMVADSLELQPKKAHMVLIHSLSNYEIWLANSRNPKMTVSLVPELWSTFYAPQAKEQWSCIQVSPGHEQKVACQQVLAMCELAAQVPDKSNAKINSWVANNLSYSEMAAYLQRIGFQFRT